MTGQAQRPSGPDVRVLHDLADLDEVHRLIDRIWRPEPGAEPVQVELLRALSHAGNYVAGAYEDGRMVGLSVAFFADPPGEALHSHITGALPGRGVGLALKHHQRDWALARGLRRITWTYDPLVRRNAYFNLVKLGARPEEYLPSFYGVMADSINSGDETDRVLAVWHLDASTTPTEAAPPPEPLLECRNNRPVQHGTDAATVLIAVPEDIEDLRRTDPAGARDWRLAVRETLGGLIADGARVIGFHDRSAYLVDRAPNRPPEGRQTP
ncbi:GNAT family N-acetyltransferase [Actinomadura hibisca]|uniref:GNAT family N-acetyltransferase n=1 Tax=Actinomadura hibisca TaxID=68565 RepID=UPI00082E0E2D|nr:GNAT family N-acetyltransferase [Actinomadura hibisca]